MSLYNKNIKLFLVGDITAEHFSSLIALSMVEAYKVLRDSKDAGKLSVCNISTPDLKEDISAPPTGVTFIIKATTGADELTRQFISLWEEAGLEKPSTINLDEKGGGASDIAESVIDNLYLELLSACKRNVTLRNQVSILREEIEQANIQLNQMEELVASDTTGAQSLLWQTDADAGFVKLSRGELYSQRLPLTINVWRLGAVSILTSSEKDASLNIRLRAMEDNSIIGQWDAAVPTGVAWLHLPITTKIRSFNQLIYIDIENRNSADCDINLGVGRVLNPDEMLIDDGKPLDVSLALKLWAGTPLFSNTAAAPASTISENLARSLIENAGNRWITNAEPASEIEKPPKWFVKFDKQIRVHPSVGTIAAAKSYLSHDTGVDGLLIDFSLTDRDAQIVQCCIVAFPMQDDNVPSPGEAAHLAELNADVVQRYPNAFASRWITALPSTMICDIPLFFERPLKDFAFYLMTRVAGNSASNCNAHFHNLRYVFRRPD